MKKYFAGLIAGVILATATIAFAADPIKLIVNGKEIQSDVPPQIIDGRTMVPARFLAEALGAKVEWDAANNSVVVTGGVYSGATPTDLPAIEQPGTTITAPPDKPQISEDMVLLKDLIQQYGVKGGTDNDHNIVITANTVKIVITQAQIKESTENSKTIDVDFIVDGQVTGKIKVGIFSGRTYVERKILDYIS